MTDSVTTRQLTGGVSADNMGDMSKASAYVAYVRRALGMTQEQFSEAIGCDRSYVAMIETERRPPSWNFLYKMGDVAKIPIVDVLRNAGLLPESPADEMDLAAIVALYPSLASVIEYSARTGQRGLLEHLERQAKFLLMEAESQGVKDREPGGGSTAASPMPGD